MADIENCDQLALSGQAYTVLNDRRFVSVFWTTTVTTNITIKINNREKRKNT